MIAQPIQIAPGQFAVFDGFGRDSNGAPAQSLGSLTATIDDYTSAFVSKYQGHIAITPKATPAAGVTKVVHVTLHGTDANGGALPDVPITANIQGPPPPPLAVTLDTANLSVAGVPSPAPLDPGSPTATIV